MKRLFLILTVVLSLATLKVHGQTLFFDNIANSVWSSDEYFKDSVIKLAKNIGLYKLNYPIDSLKINRTIWTFNDDLTITITFYDVSKKTSSIVAAYKYSADKEKGIIKIIYDDKLTLTYKIGVASTGNHAILIRKKK